MKRSGGYATGAGWSADDFADSVSLPENSHPVGSKSPDALPFRDMKMTRQMRHLVGATAAVQLAFCVTPAFGIEIHVSPAGRDTNPGTAAQPLASLAAAQQSARRFAGRAPVTVWLHSGVFYLPATLQFTAADSGTKAFPVVYAAAPGEEPVISGGQLLKLTWTPYRDGILQAKVPAGFATDQLFVNDALQVLARYPNFDPQEPHFNGYAPDAISPQRVARWADPRGGYIHALHGALWGGMHYVITGKDAAGHLTYEGGWQNNRSSGMHPKYRFVENIFEELDAPGEWFLQASNATLYFYPPAGLDLATAKVEGVRLRHLIEFDGSAAAPVKFVTLRGLTFRHALRTFMENREPLLRTDWTTYRGGALLFNGAEDCAVEDCFVDRVGGNAIFVNNYNRRLAFRGCHIAGAGANGFAFIGDPKAVRDGIGWKQQNDFQSLDRTPGPQTDNFPAECLVDDCLIHGTGRIEKQTAPVEIDMAQDITVRHCSIYDVPRAGINIGDGCWGGHVIEFCDVFDTVRETGDHGCFNSWGRDRFWNLRGVPEGELPKLAFLDVVKPNTLRHNRWRCDHGWDVDLDDGSSRYIIADNLLLHGGLKLREGFGRIATNNVIVGNSLHPHVWFPNSGDIFERNIVMGAYQPAIMKIPKWGAELDYNLFTTSDADRTKFAAQGCDAHSLVGDPLFVNPAAGDFQVKDGSPALKLGFVNFAMDQFGVVSPRLKAIARTPVIPAVSVGGPAATTPL